MYLDGDFSDPIEKGSDLPSFKLRICNIDSGCKVDEEAKNHQPSKYGGKRFFCHFG